MPLFESSKKRFYKLPYIGNSSNQTKMKLKNIFLKYCKPNTNIELVFSSIKISSLFSMKDRVPLDVRTSVVYKLFVAAVKLITLVAQNDIYYFYYYNCYYYTNYFCKTSSYIRVQLGLKSVRKETKSRMYKVPK